MRAVGELIRDVLAVIGALFVAGFGLVAAWVAKEAVIEFRSRRRRRRHEANTAMDRLHADIKAFEAGEKP